MDMELANTSHKIFLLDYGEKALMEERSKIKNVFQQVDVESSLKISKQRLLEFICLKLAFHLSTKHPKLDLLLGTF